MSLEEFREKVWEYRRQAGFSQTALADTLGLHPKVLSQKLTGSSGYSLNHPEIKQIIKTLAGWEAITSRAEAIDLLAALSLKETSTTAALNGKVSKSANRVSSNYYLVEAWS